MHINILQHTPNEGPGNIVSWALSRGYEIFVYHPYQFNGILPDESETDLLIILGGPMSPNDSQAWIDQERNLIRRLLKQNKPILGICFGAQQISKVLGGTISKAPFKEVGWANVFRKSKVIPGLPNHFSALHWHEETFQVPNYAELLFSSKLLRNQGFLYHKNVIGLQFHIEPSEYNINEIVINDGEYANHNNSLNQTADLILAQEMPPKNKTILYKILDFIMQ